MTNSELDDICTNLFDLGLKSTRDFNNKQRSLFLFLDLFNYLQEDGLNVYLSNNLNPPFDIQPNINSMRELGVSQAADKFEFIKNRFDGNRPHQEGETWDEYKTRIGIRDEVFSWDTTLLQEMSDQFPYAWIAQNYSHLTEGLNFKRP